MFLLDTNVLSELRKIKARRADPSVAAWAEATPLDAMYLSVITIEEIEIGCLRAARRDAAKARALRAWIDQQVMTAFRGRILDVTVEVVQRSARMHVPQSRAIRDGIIAATAFVHGLTVVTRNVSDFAPTGVAVVNPWSPPVRTGRT